MTCPRARTTAAPSTASRWGNGRRRHVNSHSLAQAPSRSPNAEKSEGPSPLCVTVSMQEMEEEFRKRQEERKKSDKKRIVTEAEGDLLV